MLNFVDIQDESPSPLDQQAIVSGLSNEKLDMLFDQMLQDTVGDKMSEAAKDALRKKGRQEKITMLENYLRNKQASLFFKAIIPIGRAKPDLISQFYTKSHLISTDP